MYCRNCGVPLAESDQFCGSCGTRVPRESAPTTNPVQISEPPEPERPATTEQGGPFGRGGGCLAWIVVILVGWAIVSTWTWWDQRDAERIDMRGTVEWSQGRCLDMERTMLINGDSTTLRPAGTTPEGACRYRFSTEVIVADTYTFEVAGEDALVARHSMIDTRDENGDLYLRANPSW